VIYVGHVSLAFRGTSVGDKTDLFFKRRQFAQLRTNTTSRQCPEIASKFLVLL